MLAVVRSPAAFPSENHFRQLTNISRHKPAPLMVLDERQGFEDFLAAFASLAIRMVHVDCQILEESADDNSTKLRPPSYNYLIWLHQILFSGSALWKHLGDVDQYDVESTITVIIERITRPSCNGISLISRLLDSLLHQSQTTPVVMSRIWIPIYVLLRILDHYGHLQASSLETQNELLPLIKNVPSEAFRCFQSLDSKLQIFVSKQVPVLSLEVCRDLIYNLSELLNKILATSDNDLPLAILKDRLGIMETFSDTVAPIIAEEAWKFQLLRKCFLEGRMEIRIQGVESMQQELLMVHRRFVQGNHSNQQHPIVRFLCDFILDNKLLDYLVGVGSHAQLINRAGNIVGFLVVTFRYTERESDLIWKTVTSSQDPGVVSAILQMLQSIIHISPYETLLYLVTKLNEVPLQSWDNSMTHYTGELIRYLIMKWKDARRNMEIDNPPYHMCIRLIQEAAVEQSLSFQKRRSLQAFASASFQNLLEVGPSDEDRLQIYQDCFENLAKHTAVATGCITVLNILLRFDAKTDISTLAADFDLANLAIAEFEHTTEKMFQLPQDFRYDECLTVRLELLQQIITCIPNSISEEQGQHLWDSMIGPKAPNTPARDSALVMLVNATSSSRKRNSFIDRCVSNYLPSLHPRLFTLNVLYFAQQTTEYENLVSGDSQITAESQPGRLGVEILWRIALMAPPNSIERRAIEVLVASYLDGPRAKRAPKAAIQRMHVEVVERCISQLTTAASQLKAFNDGTSSGEDEPMVIVASDEEVQMQKLTFARSLLILRELVHSIKTHPSYSPVPPSHPQASSELEEINGNPIVLRYQPFSGGTHSGIRTIQMGDLESIEDLTKRFATLTGFARFTIIAGGQKINVDQCAKSTIRESKMHEKGLVIVKKIQSTESIPDLTPARVLKPLEVEVMSHFTELHQLLALEEMFAMDVRFSIRLVFNFAD